MTNRRFALPVSAFLLIALRALAPAQENVWTSHGPTGVGVVNDVAVGDGVAYAATPNGVFRSNDGGASWRPSGLAGEWIAQVLEPSGVAVVVARGASGILYASRDEGETWAPVPGLTNVTVAAIDPGEPSTVYAGAGGSIWKSTDAATSWQRLSATPGSYGPVAFAFDSRAIYARVYDQIDGNYELYRSSDGGVGWTVVSAPIPYPTTVASGAVPGVVYIGGQGSFCRSADSAATWTCSGFPESPFFILELPGDSSAAASRILAAASGGGYVSRDGGATWARGNLAVGGNNYVGAFACDASGSLVLASTNVGIFRSQDRGDSWTPASVGLRSSVINALAVDPHDPSTVWAVGEGFDGTSPGLFRSTDAGLTWSLGSGPAGSPSFGALVIDHEHPSTLYWGGSAVYRSDDSGADWTSSTLPGGAIVDSLVVDPGSLGRVWAASSGGLFRSDDGARTWSSTPALTQEIYSILLDSKRPGTMYAGSYFDYVDGGYYPGPEGGSIFVSRDSGASWNKEPNDFTSAVFAIAADPFLDGVLYAGTAVDGVFRSSDDGATWQASNLRLIGIASLVADPVRPGQLYCSTDQGGVYRTIDGAHTWQPFSSGLGPFEAHPLVISPDGRWLHTGTYGGGVFDLALEGPYTCSPTATRLCLVGGRYAVEVVAGRGGDSPSNLGAAHSLSDRAGYFALPFATGDFDLPEVVVKMLPEGTFGSGGAPVFYSSLTTLPYVLTMTDTVTGRTQSYASDPDAPLCGGTDIALAAPGEATLRRDAPKADAPALSLLGGRFSLTLDAHNPHGQTATGVVMSSGDRFGFFSLPDVTGDPKFPEVVVKMIDATAFDGNFWFFHTGLTSLSYTLTVTDSLTTVVRTYESGTPFCGGADTQAFSDYFIETQ